MAVSPETIARVQAGINELVQNSPASTKQNAEGAMIANLKKGNPEGAMISAMKRPAPEPVPFPEVPEYELGLGSVLETGDLSKKAKLEALNAPIDQSQGVELQPIDTATEKIATSRVLGTEGADDYKQYEYGLNDKDGAASSGAREGDVYVENLRAGDAGLNIATGSVLNPLDGSDGNPAFFRNRYPALNTAKVEPFHVKIPAYNMEVTSDTLDPDKLAFQVATMIGGKPVPTYVGYTNSGFDVVESWYSGLIKGIQNVPVNLYGMLRKGTLYGSSVLASQGIRQIANMQKFRARFTGEDTAPVDKMLNRELSKIADVYDELAGSWNIKVADWNRRFNTDLTEYAGFGAKFSEGAPTVFAQIGLVAAIAALTGGTGLSPIAAGWLTTAISGGAFGLAQGAEEFEMLKGKPITPLKRFQRTEAGTLGSIALNSFGLWSMFGNRVAAARQFTLNYGKRLASAGGRGAVEGMLGEGLTEWGDQVLQNIVTYNMGDDQRANRLNEYVMAFALGAVGGILSIPVQIRNEKIQIAKEQILAGKIKADAPEFVKELNEAVTKLADAGRYSKADALEIILAMASPEGQEYFKRKDDETLAAMLDRITPEAVEYARQMGARQSAQFIKELNELDQKVYASLPEQIDAPTRRMVSRAMQGIASVVTRYGGNFRMPKFVIRDNQPMAYEPQTNTLFINTQSTGEAADLMMVQDNKLPLIDPVQRGILHELGHMLDVQLGRGTNYKEFLPTYFEAITKVFGKDKAQRIQQKMPDSGDRIAFEKSKKQSDKQEKAMDSLTGNINEKNTGEYFAYAIGRLGRKVGKVFGLEGSEVADYVDAANILASTLKIPAIQRQLNAYQQALNTLIAKNDETLQAMAKAQGNKELARKIQDYVAGDTEALSREDVIALYEILSTYAGVDGMKIIDDVFQGVEPETFMERAEREFKGAIRQQPQTVGDLQKAIKAKEKRLGNPQEVTNADVNDGEYNEETIDVSEFLNAQKKKQVSSLEKRAAEKPDGLDYAADTKKVADIMKKTGKAPKWYSRWFSNGDINTALWAIGGKELVDHFDLLGKMNRSSDEATKLMTEFEAKVNKALGFKNNIERDRFLNNASIKNIEVGMAKDPLTDETITRRISPLVAMSVYLHAKNPKTYRNMLNAFDGNEDVMNHVIDSLTKEQKLYADTMQEFIKDNWTRYKKSFEQEGDSVEDEPYWPIYEATHVALGERKVNSNIARKEGKNYAISLDIDAREIFNTYLQRVAGADHNVYSTIRRIKDLFGYQKGEYSDDFPTQEYRKLSDQMWATSKQLRGIALNNLGSERNYDRFLALVDDFLAKREASLVGSEALNIAARNLTGGLLQWKPIQFLKNLSNAAGFWGLVPAGGQGQYWRDTAWAATHPIEAAKYMMERVPYIRNRFKGQNVDEMLTEQTAGTDSLLMNWAKNSTRLSPGAQQVVSNLVALTQASRRAGYTPMLSGDLAANVIGGYGLLKQYEALYGDKAGDKLSADIVNHQASSNQATRSLLQREWGRDIRGEFTRFASEGVQKIKSSASALAQAQRGERSYGSAIKEILSTFSSMLVFALISAGVIDLFDSDDENDEEVYKALGQEGISALVGGSVIGNSMIAPVVSALFGGQGTFGTPMSRIATADLHKLSKGDWQDIVLDGIGATALPGIKNLVSGGEGAYGAATASTPQEFRAGLYQAGGRTPEYARKRAGIKKESLEKNDEE